MWFCKKSEVTYICTGCQHVIASAPFKVMQDGFHKGKVPFCFTCAPKYDGIKVPRNYYGGEVRYFRNDVPCDSNGDVICYPCKIRNEKEEEEAKKKAKRDRKNK